MSSNGKESHEDDEPSRRRSSTSSMERAQLRYERNVEIEKQMNLMKSVTGTSNTSRVGAIETAHKFLVEEDDDDDELKKKRNIAAPTNDNDKVNNRSSVFSSITIDSARNIDISAGIKSGTTSPIIEEEEEESKHSSFFKWPWGNSSNNKKNQPKKNMMEADDEKDNNYPVPPKKAFTSNLAPLANTRTVSQGGDPFLSGIDALWNGSDEPIDNTINRGGDGSFYTKDLMKEKKRKKMKNPKARRRYVTIILGLFGITLILFFTIFLSLHPIKTKDFSGDGTDSNLRNEEEEGQSKIEATNSVSKNENNSDNIINLSSAISKSSSTSLSLSLNNNYEETLRYDELLLYFTLQNYSSQKQMETVGTPQNSALLWLNQQEDLKNIEEQLPMSSMMMKTTTRTTEKNNVNDLCNSTPFLQDISQRYAMAVFYFSTCCGDDDIENDNTYYSSDDNKFNNYWNNDNNWMTQNSNINSVCSWYGVTCDETNSVISLDMSNNQLHGKIPSELSILKHLNVLNLEQNESLQGTIPTELRSITNLKIKY